MAQERKHKSKKDETQVEEVPQSTTDKEELDEGVDDILAEIDDVLETNAEEFVKSYIQKGGQ